MWNEMGLDEPEPLQNRRFPTGYLKLVPAVGLLQMK
jgi:hypothetical protein